jgi:cytoskeletal protein RodZ
MALSMDEQRMLAEIERRLAAENPGLASDLTSFRKPSRVSVLRSTRARVIGSLFTVAVVAMVSLMVYAMLPFRSGGRTISNHPVTTTSVNGGPDQAKIGVEPAQSSSAQSSSAQSSSAQSSSAQSSSAQSSAAQSSTGKTSASDQSSASTATGKARPSARSSASSAAHSSSAPAVAQSGTGASAAVNGP